MAAKRKPYPKRPKMGSSIETFKRWEERCKRIKAHNAKIDSVRKQKEQILNRYRK